MTRDQIIALLRARATKLGSQTALCRQLGISNAYLSDILYGKREPGAKVLAALGLRKVVSYERLAS